MWFDTGKFGIFITGGFGMFLAFLGACDSSKDLDGSSAVYTAGLLKIFNGGGMLLAAYKKQFCC